MKTNAEFFYTNVVGRMALQCAMRLGFFKLVALYLRSGASRSQIADFIERNKIDMTPFEGQTYRSFSDFFRRSKNEPTPLIDSDPGKLISPCDGLLSYFPIESDLSVPMKGSRYRL